MRYFTHLVTPIVHILLCHTLSMAQETSPAPSPPSIRVIGVGSEWFWSMAQFLAVSLTLFFIYRQIKLQGYGNMLSSLNALQERWRAETLRNARRLVCESYQQKTNEINEPELLVAGFFEELGLYLKKKALETDLVWELYSFWIENYWRMLEPSILATRSKATDDSWFSNFQYLYEQMAVYSKQKGISMPADVEADIKTFIDVELQRIEFIDRIVPEPDATNK
ncbi:MAG TPA: hypothetical protein VF527_21735 [Pyrinomonadaceae bacterium]